MKATITIGQEVNSAKFGKGVITKIITKSTGYVEVNYNGVSKKEMAFNLTDNEGTLLKDKKLTATAGMNKLQKHNYELSFFDKSTYENLSKNDYDAMMQRIANDNRPSSLR